MNRRVDLTSDRSETDSPPQRARFGCRNISDTAKRLGDAVQKYLRARRAEGKGLPVYDKRDATGFWRLFVCRERNMAPSSELGWRDWLRPGAGPPKAPEESAEDAHAEKEKSETPFEYPDEEFSLPAPTTKGEKSEVLVMLQVRKAATTRRSKSKRSATVCAPRSTKRRERRRRQSMFKCAWFSFTTGNRTSPRTTLEIRNIQTNALSEKSADVIHEQMCGLEFSLSATAFFKSTLLPHRRCTNSRESGPVRMGKACYWTCAAAPERSG